MEAHLQQRAAGLIAGLEFIALIVVAALAFGSAATSDQASRAVWRREVQTAAAIAQALREVSSTDPARATAGTVAAYALTGPDAFPIASDETALNIAGVSHNVHSRLDRVLRGDKMAIEGLAAYATAMADVFETVTQLASLRAEGKAVPDEMRLRLELAVNRSAA